MLYADLGNGAQLRSLEPWQAAEFFAHVERISDHIRPYLSMTYVVTSVAEAQRYLQRYTDDTAKDGARLYGIWLDDVLSGGLAFRHFDAASGCAELGAWLAPEAIGKGIMTTATRRLLGWAFTERGMDRVEWLAVVGNEPSIAVARRLGMTYEGVKRSDYPLNGVRHDSEVWAMTGEDWRGQWAIIESPDEASPAA